MGESDGGDKNNDDADVKNDTTCNGCGKKLKNGEVHGDGSGTTMDRTVTNQNGDTVETISK